MLKVACTMGLTGCYIGHLFSEIEPPCKACGSNAHLEICGTLHTGEQGRLIVRDYGFDFYGNPQLVEDIKRRWCDNGKLSAK